MAMTTNTNNEQEMEKGQVNTPEPQEPVNNDDQGKDLPAEVPEEKKGFHPIQGLKNFGQKFSEDHPNITSGLKTAGKVAVGVGIGAVGTVAVLAKIASDKAGSEDNDDNDLYDEDDAIDSTATELDDSDQ